MKDKSQERVSEIIAMTARGERIVDLSDIVLSQVETSSLYLFYNAVKENILTLLESQKVIVDELADREKQHREKKRDRDWEM